MCSLLRPINTDDTQPAPGCFTGPLTGAGSYYPGTVIQTVSPSQAVIVKEATWVIPGSSPASIGGALRTPGADITVAMTTLPNGSNPRIDLLTAQIIDPGSSTTPVTCDFVWVIGTPGASPVAPALPASATLVTTVNVPSGAASNLVNANIVNDRLFTGVRGSILNVPNKTKISNIQAGDKCLDAGSVRWEYDWTTGWIQLRDQVDIQHGVFTAICNGTTVTVNFPRAFTAAPHVVLTAAQITGNTPTEANIIATTTTGFTCAVRPSAGGTYAGTVAVEYIAAN